MLYVGCQYIWFDVHVLARCQASKRGCHQCLRNERDRAGALRRPCNGQRDAVDGDRSLRDDGRSPGGHRVDGDRSFLVMDDDRLHWCRGSDVPRDDMAMEAAVRAQ